MAEEKDLKRVWYFLKQYFFPEEPISRSIHFCDRHWVNQSGVLKETWYFFQMSYTSVYISNLQLSKYLRYYYRTSILSACLEGSSSILAEGAEGEIAGEEGQSDDKRGLGSRLR